MDKSPEEDGFHEFNNYFEFIENVGAGGFGKVVRAKYLKDGKVYAVKVIKNKLFYYFKCINIKGRTLKEQEEARDRLNYEYSL